MRGDHGPLEGRGAVQANAHALAASEHLEGKRMHSLARLGDEESSVSQTRLCSNVGSRDLSVAVYVEIFYTGLQKKKKKEKILLI